MKPLGTVQILTLPLPRCLGKGNLIIKRKHSSSSSRVFFHGLFKQFSDQRVQREIVLTRVFTPLLDDLFIEGKRYILHKSLRHT